MGQIVSGPAPPKDAAVLTSGTLERGLLWN